MLSENCLGFPLQLVRYQLAPLVTTRFLAVHARSDCAAWQGLRRSATWSSRERHFARSQSSRRRSGVVIIDEYLLLGRLALGHGCGAASSSVNGDSAAYHFRVLRRCGAPTPHPPLPAPPLPLLDTRQVPNALMLAFRACTAAVGGPPDAAGLTLATFAFESEFDFVAAVPHGSSATPSSSRARPLHDGGAR